MASVGTFTQVIGQAWCATSGPHKGVPELGYPDQRIVLCNVHRDVTTGAVTYVPISFEDLPRVTEAAAP